MNKQRSIRLITLGLGFLALAIFPALVLASNRTDSHPPLQFNGIVMSMPTNGLAGQWTIGDMTLVSDDRTNFHSDHPFLGACVLVGYERVNDQNMALDIRLSDHCAGVPHDLGIREVNGIVESFPPGLAGAWQVSNTTYTATHMTRFQQSSAAFAVGACVEIRYIITGSIALSIKTEDGSLCGSGEITGLAKLKGALVSFPPELTGTWSLSATGGITTFEVVSQTRLERRHGDFYIGACIGVVYDPNTRVARVVETESPDDCGGVETSNPLSATIGLITQAPSGTLFGTWVISGLSVEAITGTTRFGREDGPLAVGDCARASYFVSGATNIAVRISGLEHFQCAGEAEHHVAFGNLESLPSTPDLIGTWTIGGRDYQVTTDTLLMRGPFTTGLLVQVNFVRQSDGTLLALRIDAKHRVHDGDRRLARSIGLIESRPASPTVAGTWVIASATYQVSDTTRLEGLLEISMCAKVYYRVVDGQRLASKIEQQVGSDCASIGHLRVNIAFGFVGQMPPAGLIGTWSIGGVLYDINASTDISDAHGVVMAGSFVKVKYVVQNGVNVALKIETHVPPEAGEVDTIGLLSFTVRTAHGPATTPPVWYIAGQAYTILDATLLDDSQGALTSNQPVRVNAYTDGATQVATSVTALQAFYTSLMPIVTR